MEEREGEGERERTLTHRTHSAIAQGFSFMLYLALSKGILTALVINNVRLLLVTSSFINMKHDGNVT